MAQHFLLSAAARTLSLKSIFSEGEEAAYDRFRRLRWTETDGEPVCPSCVNRSGFSGGSKSRKDWSHGKRQQSEPLFT